MRMMRKQTKDYVSWHGRLNIFDMVGHEEMEDELGAEILLRNNR